MTRRILIRNARLVNEGRIVDGDLLIADGRIDRIASSITLAAEIEIDAAGAWLLPGMIDDQVHFREPGLTHKGCIASDDAALVHQTGVADEDASGHVQNSFCSFL